MIVRLQISLSLARALSVGFWVLVLVSPLFGGFIYYSVLLLRSARGVRVGTHRAAGSGVGWRCVLLLLLPLFLLLLLLLLFVVAVVLC